MPKPKAAPPAPSIRTRASLTYPSLGEAPRVPSMPIRQTMTITTSRTRPSRLTSPVLSRPGSTSLRATLTTPSPTAPRPRLPSPSAAPKARAPARSLPTASWAAKRTALSLRALTSSPSTASAMVPASLEARRPAITITTQRATRLRSRSLLMTPPSRSVRSPGRSPTTTRTSPSPPARRTTTLRRQSSLAATP